MSNTDDNIQEIKEKLNYIGLDLQNIPYIFKNYRPVEYTWARGYEDNKFRIYKFIDIDDIQILITPKNRLDSLHDRYESASPIISYLDPKKEEDIIKHATFLNMLTTVDIEHINRISQEQNKISNQIPFKVKYEENYLWQIYYSEISKKYFMLVPAIDSEYAGLFYLIKKQIECYREKKKEKIFVPICNCEYSGEYLQRSELADIENYLWLFTKQWPIVYEVRDKENKLSIQIVGETRVYEKYKSYYKVVLRNKEEAVKFFKLIKALYILQIEVPEKYSFSVKISPNGGIEFFYKNVKLEYDYLSKFIEKEHILILNNCKEIIRENKKCEERLEELKLTEIEKEAEYKQKEREISVYLECKKTFIGKLRYFFKHKKLKKENNKSQEKTEKIKPKENTEIIEEKTDKPYYTIEDLIKITKKLNNKIEYNKNLKLDINALYNRIKMIDNRIKNANQYLEEIDKHNKSIFEFWRFANKDNIKALNEARKIKEEENKINLEKTFNYEEDFENIGKKADTIQRKYLKKEECDSVYLATTELLDLINIIDKYNKIGKIAKEDSERIRDSLEQLQTRAEKEKVFFNKEDFDIFGGLADDRTKIKQISGKKHREIEKNKFRILDLTKNTTYEQYKNNLKKVANNINRAIEKTSSIINMSVYKASRKAIINEGFEIFHINPENAIKDVNGENTIYLYRINIKEKMNLIYLSNIIYFDNYNETLPIGMDISDEILIDMKNYEKLAVKSEEFRINDEKDEINVINKKIIVYEYDIIQKKDRKEESQNDK